MDLFLQGLFITFPYNQQLIEHRSKKKIYIFKKMLENEISMPYTEKKKFSFGEIINNKKKKIK